MESTDRGVQSAAMAGSKTATGTASGYGNTAGDVGATLIPGLTRQFTNPEGFSPTDLNNQFVAAEQASGGATGALNDQARLQAARTRNTGSTAAIMDQAARRGGQNLSTAALDIQNKNAMLKEQQRQQAAKQLESIYGTDVGAQLKSMGIANEDLGTALEAGKSGWLQNTLNTINTITGAAKSAAPLGG